MTSTSVGSSFWVLDEEVGDFDKLGRNGNFGKIGPGFIGLLKTAAAARLANSHSAGGWLGGPGGRGNPGRGNWPNMKAAAAAAGFAMELKGNLGSLSRCLSLELRRKGKEQFSSVNLQIHFRTSSTRVSEALREGVFLNF